MIRIKLFNICFVLLLFIPLVFYFSTPLKKISKAENRTLTPIPSLQAEGLSVKQFTQKLESHWNDHFGLREWLITVNTRLQEHVLRTSSVEKVIRGKDGWLYAKLNSILSDHLGYSQPSEQKIAKWVRTLEKRRQWLSQKGISYIFMPIPSKMNIYAEYLPLRYSVFRGGNSETRLEKLMGHLQQTNHASSAVDLTTIFRESKGSQLLYFKTDTHWNWYGAFIAFRSVMENVKKNFPDITILESEDFLWKTIARDGDLGRMLGGSYLAETVSRPEKRERFSSKMVNLPGHDPSTTRRHPMVTTNSRGELTAVVSYDSFGAFLFPFLAEQFRRVVYVSRRDEVWLKGFLEKERPDVFIHQRAARKLWSMVRDDWAMTDIVETASE